MKRSNACFTIAFAFVSQFFVNGCANYDTSDPAGDAMERQVSYEANVADERTELLSDAIAGP